MLRTFPLQSGQAVWVIQAGWDVELARELQSTVPEFRDLKIQSFGKNIAVFKLTGGQSPLALAAQSN
jgi:hypothetical protein